MPLDVQRDGALEGAGGKRWWDTLFISIDAVALFAAAVSRIDRPVVVANLARSGSR
jgi:hypothetical protein